MTMKSILVCSSVLIRTCLVIAYSGNDQTSEVAHTGSKTDTVIIENMQFKPQELNLTRGDTVIWINKGVVDHNVTDKLSKQRSSGDFQPGESWLTIHDKSMTIGRTTCRESVCQYVEISVVDVY